jgi:uncharacterized membrane protein
MSKFVVVVFPGETQAYQGVRALKELHLEGSLTLYGMAVVAKDAKGTLSVKDAADAGPLGTAVGALVGGLVGVLAGPVGVLAGVAGGTVIGSMFDLFSYGVGEDFVAKVTNELAPGRTAIIAEIAETWTTPLDARMSGLGGTILRTRRADFEDEQASQEVAAAKADYEQVRAEYAQATAEARARLKAKVDQAKANLEQAEKRVETRLDALDKEAQAKIAALETQISQAQADAKEKLRQRVAAIRAEYETRSAKLRQAWALTKEALAA